MDGKLIVFEGIEGCGKTTQIERSRHWFIQSGWQSRLQPRDLVLTREPGGTRLGAGIRQLLLHHDEPIHDRAELLLYAADRAEHVENFLRPHLTRGAIVFCDRYTDSTIAYQGYGRGLDLTLIEQLNHVATSGLKSDLTVWLDLTVEEGLARVQQRGKRDAGGTRKPDRIEQADVAFHERVQQGFAQLAVSDSSRFVRVDASGSELAVAERIEAVLSHALDRWFPGAANSRN